MIEETIKKIKEEMEKSKVPYIQAIGNYVINQIEVNGDAAKEVVEGKKTLKGAFEKVMELARKNATAMNIFQGAVGGGTRCAVLTDEEVYKQVREYYGFEVEQQATKVVINEDVNVKEPVKEEEHKNFKVDLKDLLRRKGK